MKKLIYILLLLPFVSFGQTANGTETKQKAFQSSSPQTVTVPTGIATMGTTGVIGRIDPLILPIQTAVQDSIAAIRADIVLPQDINSVLATGHTATDKQITFLNSANSNQNVIDADKLALESADGTASVFSKLLASFTENTQNKTTTYNQQGTSSQSVMGGGSNYFILNNREASGDATYVFYGYDTPGQHTIALDENLILRADNSAGAIQGFALTNNGNGTVNIATGTAFLRATNDPYATLVKYTIPAVTNLALTDNATNFLLVDYNGGTPAITVTTNSATINTETNSIAYAVSRVGTTLDYVNLVGQNVDANAKLRIRFLNQEGIRRANGVALGFVNRNLTLTAGTLFSGLIRINSPAFNTNTPDTFTQVYNNGAVWTRTTGQTQVNNTQYNNSGVLTNLAVNDYRTDWIYLLPNNPSKLYLVLGTVSHPNIAAARAATPPATLPSELQTLGLLVGRSIIQRLGASISEVSSAFDVVFPANPVPNHNDLAGLNVGDYQHLTAAQLAALGINGTAIAYVDLTGNNSTAQVGNNRKAFLTVDAALDALPVGGGVVRIGLGSFNSPTPSKIKSNTVFIGYKEPTINSTVTISAPNTRPTITAPTALINGTILTGEFSALDKSNVVVLNLGIDVGKTWIDTFNGGTPVGGLVIASTAPTTPIKNIQVSNVTVLGYSAATAQHCMLFENIMDSKFNNLTTYYHVHGVAIKGLNITLDGANLHSHGNDGLIIKSDTYAPTRDVSVNNVNISSISGYEGGGVILEEGVNGSSLLERISLNNINLKFVKFGLANVNKVSNVNISNFNLYDSQTFGIKFDNNVDKINLSGINIIQTTTEGIDASITGSAVVNISNSNISNATNAGYKLTTASTSIINIVNSNTLNTTASYLISGTGVFGSSNFGTGTTTGYINFRNPFVKSLGRIFTVGDSFFGDLASTSGSLDLRFSSSLQVATIESYNFSTALRKPLELLSSTLKFSALSGTGTRDVNVLADGTLAAGPLATVNGTFTPTITGAFTALKSYYEKTGNILTVQVNFTYAATAGSSTTSGAITLPNSYTLANSTAGRSIATGTVTTGSNVSTGGSYVQEKAVSSTTVDLTVGNNVWITATYAGSVTFRVEVN